MNLSFPTSPMRALAAAAMLGLLAIPAASAAVVHQQTGQSAHREVQRAAQKYTFTSYAYPNDTFTQLLGINNSGLIAGYHGIGTPAHPNKGFTLTLPNKITAENYPKSVQTQVIGINDNGWTVGFYIDSKGVNHAFSKTTKFTNLDAPGTTLDQDLGVADTNAIAGYAQYNNKPSFHPYVRLSDGSFEFPSITNAQATDINKAGLTSGFQLTSGTASRGFLWKNGGTTQYLKYPGSTFTQALGLNNKGQVVGTYNDGTGTARGFVYTISSKTFQAVNYPGSTSTVINGINDNGWMVGFYTAKNGNTIGFVAKPGTTTGTTKSTTTISSSQVSTCPCTPNQQFTFTVNVTPGATGSVVLYDDWTSGSYSGTDKKGTATLSGGQATFTGITFGSATHHVYATYLGNSKYAPSTSTKLVFAVFHS